MTMTTCSVLDAPEGLVSCLVVVVVVVHVAQTLDQVMVDSIHRASLAERPPDSSR